MSGPNKEAPCRRPPRGTSKAALTELHKAKMMGKFFRNQEAKETRILSWLGDRDIWLRKNKRPGNFEAARRLHMTNQRKALRALKMKELK